MKQIPLTQGMVTLVDDEDYERFAAFRWHASRHEHTWYAVRNAPRDGGPHKMLLLHRLILHALLGLEVDHIDGDGLNNIRANLRLCNHRQNCSNQRAQLGRTSRFKGVSWHQTGKKWQAGIQQYSKQHGLGLFVSEQEAALAYNEAALDLFGEFARLNTIPGRG